MTDDRTDAIKALYQRAFREFGSVALWNIRPKKEPTPADALRTHGRMEGRRLAERIEELSVPISKFQSDVLRLLAAQRSPDSYIAGGVAINRQGPRFSGAIDIFHDSIERQESAVKADEVALTAAGYKLGWPPTQRTGKHEAMIEIQVGWRTWSAILSAPARRKEGTGRRRAASTRADRRSLRRSSRRKHGGGGPKVPRSRNWRKATTWAWRRFPGSQLELRFQSRLHCLWRVSAPPSKKQNPPLGDGAACLKGLPQS